MPIDPRPSAFRLSCVALLAILLGFLAMPATAQERLGDPVLDGVLDMLAADLSETVILEWLATVEETPRTPSAQDLIALRQAGASDPVMVALLEKARGELETVESETEPSAAPRPRDLPADADPAAPQGAESAPARPEARSAGDFALGTRPFEPPPPSEATRLVPAGRGAINAGFTLSYSPYWLEDEERWDLYVYLNGEPLTYVPDGTLFAREPLRFNKLLTPGTQRLLVFREQHDGENDVHSARVMPLKIDFELAPGGVAEIELAYRQTILDLDDPVSYRVAQNGRLVAESEDIGGNPDAWEPLCDDLERTLGSDRDDSRFEDCVRWRDLWTTTDGPTRSQVLQAFEILDYRPVPRDQNIH